MALIKLKYSSWAFLFLFILGIGCGKDDGPEVPVEPEAVKSIDVVDLRTEDDKVFPGDDVSFTIKGIVGPLKKVEVEIGGVKAKTVIGKDGKVTVTMPEKLVFPIKITANGVVKTLKNTDGPFKGIEVRNDFEIVSASDGTFKPGDEIKLKSRGLGNSAADIEIVMGGAKVEKLKLDKGVLEFKLPAEAGFPIVIKKGKEKTMEYAKGKAPFDKFIFGETGTDGEEVSVKITTSLGEYRGLPIAVQVGDKIKASVKNMANGVKVAYAWQRVGPDNEIAGISGATKAEYTIAEEDAGKEIRVKISYKVGEKEAKKLTSESIKVFNGTFTVSRHKYASGILFSVVTSDLKDKHELMEYQWFRRKSDEKPKLIQNATESSYEATQMDVGMRIYVKGILYDSKRVKYYVVSNTTNKIGRDLSGIVKFD